MQLRGAIVPVNQI